MSINSLAERRMHDYINVPSVSEQEVHSLNISYLNMFNRLPPERFEKKFFLTQSLSIKANQSARELNLLTRMVETVYGVDDIWKEAIRKVTQQGLFQVVMIFQDIINLLSMNPNWKADDDKKFLAYAIVAANDNKLDLAELMKHVFLINGSELSAEGITLKKAKDTVDMLTKDNAIAFRTMALCDSFNAMTVKAESQPYRVGELAISGTPIGMATLISHKLIVAKLRSQSGYEQLVPGARIVLKKKPARTSEDDIAISMNDFAGELVIGYTKSSMLIAETNEFDKDGYGKKGKGKRRKERV